MPLETTGYLEYAELCAAQKIPGEERFKKGPVAVVECVQPIPCNPCEAACKFGAIAVGEPITNLPELNGEKCTGCGACVAKCPGLAIFIVDKSLGNGMATVSFPYEYWPIPEKGSEAEAVNRKGEVVCKGTVVRVANPAAYDHTPVVTVEIPAQYADEVRSIKRRKNDE